MQTARSRPPAPFLLAVCAAIGVWTVVWTGTAAGDDAGAAFYRDKTVTVIVATKPGGGYDTYGRLLARSMAKYLPGSTFTVRNVPGAGHIIGANEVYAAKPDGLTIGTFNKGLIIAQITETRGIRFDMAKFEWLGVPDSEPRVWITAKQSPVKSFRDVLSGARVVTVSSNGVGSEDYQDYVFLENIFGLRDLKVVTGYQGNDVDLALLRGEVDGKVGALSSVQPLIRNEGARVILVIGRRPVADFPDAPVLAQTAPKGREALVDIMISQAELGHPFGAPPGVPADRLLALRRAFGQALADPDLRAVAAQAGLVINPLDAAETTRLVTRATHPPADVAGLIRRVLGAK
ncbi:MAG TPA: tripartite tricarboxylate transporter substrate-binding protein [bacterium]|nr:tripartite tricarboxylate transporter substrate-binding protein [bacterium]